MYPDLESQTYFFPPVHFNRTPHDVQTVAGQTVMVRDNPSGTPQSRKRARPPPPSPQVAGTVFVENPPDLRAKRVQDSDCQDDEAQQSCLLALSDVQEQGMMVISQMQFRKYLDNQTNPERLLNPLHAAAIAQLPTVRDPSTAQHIADGECDIIIIHRQHGLIVGEVKSVGNTYLSHQPPSVQNQAIKGKVEKALSQVRNQAAALKHLIRDLPAIRITTTLMLPNINSAQLHLALQASGSPHLAQTFCQVLNSTYMSQAVSRCMCIDDLSNPSAWWRTMLPQQPDPCMTDDLYTRLVARFCGPASTVEIPTASPPCKVLRSMGQAVAETGLRFSSLTLTLKQVDILNTHPEPCFVYVHGPPGTGKTVVLVLKAVQWAQRGQKVVVINRPGNDDTVTVLMVRQLVSILGAAAAPNIHRITDPSVSQLLQQFGTDPVLILMDEAFPQFWDKYSPWFAELGAKMPRACVWIAGIWQVRLQNNLPPGLCVQMLNEPLRCPPAIYKRLANNTQGVSRYSPPAFPVATEGQLRRLRHRYQPGHSGDFPLQCPTCADLIAHLLKEELRVGQPEHCLQFRDVWILDGSHLSGNEVLIQRLQRHHQLPVKVARWPVGVADAQELALALSDQILVTNYQVVQGLERRVVIGLLSCPDLHTISRSTSFCCLFI
ncbi:uncharacterized protein LOC143284199 isoform X2 [Babylonia areolata]